MFITPPNNFLPKVHCSACYVYCQNKLLLLKRHPKKPYGNTWGVPGGKIEDHEAPDITAARELFEETGILVVPEDFVKIGTLYGRQTSLDYTFHMFYLALDVFPPLNVARKEHIDELWITTFDAKALDLIPDGLFALEHFEQFLSDFHSKSCF